MKSATGKTKSVKYCITMTELPVVVVRCLVTLVD